MRFSIEIEEEIIDRMAKRGWLAKKTKLGVLEVLPPGHTKYRETVQLIVDLMSDHPPSSSDLEMDAFYLAQICLQMMIKPHLSFTSR